MNKVNIKICGIRSLASAQVAIAAGADFLGFNFIATSKRYINPMEAKEIIGKVKNKVKTVGVFQNQKAIEVNIIAELTGLDFIQLHGEESNEYILQMKIKIIKKILLGSNLGNINKKVEYFILDRDIQGTGEMINLEKAKQISENFSIFFAGGLTPANIARVISEIKPFGVDVSSGVETNGMLDSRKIKAFIHNARGVEI